MLRMAWLIAAGVAAWTPLVALAQAPVAPPYYAMDPHSPMAPSGNSPVQQQILQNYRSQLLQSQHTLSQPGSSGSSPSQVEVNRELNQFNAVPAGPVAGAPMTAPPPPYNPVLGR